MKVYIAAPFFNFEQLLRVTNVETLLRAQAKHIEFFSPRTFGVLKDLPPDEQDKASQSIFAKNVEMLNWCDIVLAIIDDKDTGTIWEMGYGSAKGKIVIACSSTDKPVNLMLARSCFAYLHGLRKLDHALSLIVTGDIRMVPMLGSMRADT